MRNKLLSLCLNVFLLLSMGAATNVVNAEEPFIGEVRWFAGNFAPRGWSFCDGQLLPISTNTALFSLLGTTYGGDGRTNFGLPDMRGRSMMHVGSGPDLSFRRQGEKGGQESVALNTNQFASHNHVLHANDTGGDSVVPVGRVISSVGRLQLFASAADTSMNASSIAFTGNSQSHENMQPSIALNCIIALTGVYPSRN